MTKVAKAFLFISISFFLFASPVKAQSPHQVVYRFDQGTLRIKNNQSFSNKLLVENQSDQPVRLAVSKTLPGGLINLPDTLFLQAGETKSYPVKYMATRNLIKEKMQRFDLQLTSSSAGLTIQPQTSFFTRWDEDVSLLLQTDQQEYYLDQGSRQTQLLVKVSNISIVPISFRLQFSEVPDGLEITGDQAVTTIRPGETLLLPFIARNITRSDVDFQVSLTASDETGALLGQQRFRVLSVGSVRRFSAGNVFGATPDHSLALRYQTLNTGLTSVQFQSDGKVNFNEHAGLRYRVNADYFQQQEGLYMYDSYLDFQNKHVGLKVGSIYETLDYTLSGRGVKATIKMDQDRSISVYGLENQYALFSNGMYPSQNGEKIIAANYSFDAYPHQNGNLTLIHGTDERRNVNSTQLSLSSPIHLRKQQSMSVEGGISREHIINSREGKNGISAGFNYSIQTRRYHFNTHNYFSSPYYTGIRRGVSRIDSRLTRVFNDRKRLSVRVSYQNNNPGFQDGERGFRFSNHSRQGIYELGYTTTLGKVNMDIRPYYFNQFLENAMFSVVTANPIRWTSGSIRSMFNLSYYKENHRFSLNSDYGYTFRNSANTPRVPFHSLRSNLNYHFRYFGLSSYFQYNPYYLSDLQSAAKDAKYLSYSLGPNTQFQAFKSRLQMQASAMYNFYGYSRTDNYSVNAQASYRIKGNWNLTADIFYSLMESRTNYGNVFDPVYSTHSFTNNQIRLGIEKKFNTQSSSSGKKLALRYFEDNNNNGIRDRDEPLVSGILVKLAKEVARTDARGEVSFRNLPVGNYLVQIVNDQGWSVPGGSTDLVVTRNQRQEIPLIRTKILKGKLQVIAREYQDSKPSLSGIRIDAVDEHGRNYKTLSDAEGNYALYLPVSNYQVYINTDGMPFEIVNNNNQIEIGDDSQIYQLDFQYQDNRRKVDVKRF